MATVLLVLIYVAFISLGLPDALLGAAWPAMRPGFAVPVSFAGILQVIIAGGTIVSSMNSGRVLRRFGTGKVTAFSVGLTAIALLGFGLLPSFWWLIAAAIPLGLGAGSVDAGLNAFVAEHYQPEPKRRKRPDSFRTLQDRFGNPASVSTEKLRGGGGGGGHG